MVNDLDREKFESILNKQFQLKWGKSVILNNLKDIFYVPVSSSNKSNDLMPLIRLNSNDWAEIIKKGISYFSRDGQHLDLLIIPELLSLTATISKILTQPAGSTLLIGKSGIGRRSAVRIISTLQGSKLVLPSFESLVQFKIDLKLAMQLAGVEGQDVYFLMEDHMFYNKEILNIVSTLLTSGEVPGLYNSAEFNTLIADLKNEADREDYVDDITQYFSQRVYKKLHLVICLEIENSSLSNILDDCPLLYQMCYVIWQSEWSMETMSNIPSLYLNKYNKDKTKNLNSLVLLEEFYNIHKSSKTSLATPRRYISFIYSYITLFIEKTEIISQRQEKLTAGISKLSESKKVVAELKGKAMEQQQKLAEKQSKANSALDMISTTMRSANLRKQEMEILKQKTEKENEQLTKRKYEIDLELAEVEPILQEARSAVGNIKTEALSEIRSLRAPPDVIRDILEGVLRLMGIQDTSWNSMKNFLSKRGVKEDIKSFDAARINFDNRSAVERLLLSRSESFDPKVAKRASIAAAPLASWVVANVRYSTVVEKIRPLEREQWKLQENLKMTENQITELSTGLTDVDTKVAQLKNQLSTYTKEAAEIEINLKEGEEKLKSAEGLVEKLNEEYERWGEQLKELHLEIKTLPAKCLLTSAFVTYLSGEFEDERKLFLEKWKLQLFGENFDFQFEEFLYTEREQLHWKSEGLLSDKLSVQNATIILKSKYHMLILDPSSHSLKWLQTHLKHRQIEILTNNSPRFNSSVELAMRFGKVLIINDLEHIPNILLPILRNEFIYQGERRMIYLGNKLVDCHHDFLIYLCSRNVKLEIPSYAYAIVNIVNFTTTKTGLTEQLLSAAIHQQFPNLEKQKSELLSKQEELHEQQFNLQNRLLEDLVNAKGDILQNKQLLSSLNETKASSIAITTALENLKIIKHTLELECDVFRPLSIYGSDLYFTVREITKMNNMYATSINAFVRLFIKAITAVSDVEDKFNQVQKILLQMVYSFISRGILKSERLIFLLHLCYRTYPKEISVEVII